MYPMKRKYKMPFMKILYIIQTFALREKKQYDLDIITTGVTGMSFFILSNAGLSGKIMLPIKKLIKIPKTLYNIQNTKLNSFVSVITMHDKSIKDNRNHQYCSK